MVVGTVPLLMAVAAHLAEDGAKVVSVAEQAPAMRLALLRMDTVPKFVQLIKWVQQQAGVGSARVRAPRMELHGRELDEARAVCEDSRNASHGKYEAGSTELSTTRMCADLASETIA